MHPKFTNHSPGPPAVSQGSDQKAQDGDVSGEEAETEAPTDDECIEDLEARQPPIMHVDVLWVLNS